MTIVQIVIVRVSLLEEIDEYFRLMHFFAVVEGEQRSGDTQLVSQLYHLLRLQSRLPCRATAHAALVTHLFAQQI